MGRPASSHRRKPSSGKPRNVSFYRHPAALLQLRHLLPRNRKAGIGCLFGAVGIVALYVWIFYYFFVGPTGFRWRAFYGDAKYPQGFEIHGIDISRYQGIIDWDKFRANALIDGYPPRFIFIKGTEGASRTDPYFKDNFANAREYGFIRGVYHFWSNKSSAREQAYHFLDKVYLEEGDLPPVLDIEHVPNNVRIEDFQTDVLTWLHIVEDRYHVKPIIYTYYKFKEKYLSAPVFDDYPYWIAHYYVEKIAYKGSWKFWQHTDTGTLPGITGRVDLNVYNGTFYDLVHLTIGNQDNKLR